MLQHVFVEFEYGGAVFLSNEVGIDAPAAMSYGSCNWLETLYLHVALPARYIYRPMMIVRVHRRLWPSQDVHKSGAYQSPETITGVTSINLLEASE